MASKEALEGPIALTDPKRDALARSIDDIAGRDICRDQSQGHERGMDDESASSS